MSTLIQLFENFIRDLRYAARVLIKSPGFALVALLSLALGIGANAAIFQLVDAVRLRSLPVEKPYELAEVRIAGNPSRSGSFNGRFARLTNPQWELIRDGQQSFSGIFAFSSAGFDIAPSGEARNVAGLYVSGDFFRTLGVRPFAGRLFTTEDDRRGCASPGVVISHRFWQREFGGRPNILGTKLLLNRQPFEVIGITPASFFGVEVGRSFDVAVPICADPLFSETPRLDRRHSWWLAVFGRLKPGVSLEQAASQMNAMSSGVFEPTVPEVYRPDGVKNYLSFKLTALSAATGISSLRARFESPLWMLLAITGLVLLITCANLANLMLARASVRERDIAVRLAIGASRWRLIRQLLAESILLAAVGSILGIILAQVLSRVLVSALVTGSTPLFVDLQPDWRLLGFIGGLAILTCLMFGLTPALRATRTALGSILKSGARGSGGRGLGLRRVLVVSQVALALILVVGALLFVRSFQKVLNVDTGFERDGVVVTSVDLPRRNDSVERLRSLHRQILERLSSLPEVRSASEVTIVPISGSGWNNHIRIDGVAETGNRLLSNFNQVGPRYFETMSTPIIAGRDFNEKDTLTSPKVAIVDENFARRFLDGASPVGRVFRVIGGPGEAESPIEIVGQVRDSKYRDLRETATPLAYLTTAQDDRPGRSMQFVVRSDVSLAAATESMKRAILEVDPSSSIVFQDMQTQIRESLLLDRLMAMLSGFFGFLAGLIAMIGLYGVISYSVARRKHEIGIRVALGANRARVIKLILTEAAVLLAIGLTIGTGLAILAARTARSLLFGLQPHDPLTISLAVAVLALVGLAASYLPALRAARVDPMIALRDE